MYSIILFLIIVILAPIALRSFFMLLCSRIFWALIIVCVMVAIAFTLSGPSIIAARLATEKRERIQHLVERVDYLHSKIGDSYFRKWDALPDPVPDGYGVKSFVARVYYFTANGGKLETIYNDDDFDNLDKAISILQADLGRNAYGLLE
jgi:hypothetical protein